MYIYVITLGISLLLSYVSTKMGNKKIKILLQILSAIPFFIISAIRYDVGTDYLYRYRADFEYIKLGGTPPNLEIGFLMLVKLCILISKNYPLLFIITSAIIIFMIFFLIYKYSKKPVLSIFIFFAGCFFFQSMNVIRQYIASTIVLLSYQLLIDKKYKSWILCIIIAFLIHTTSIVSLIAIFLTKKVIAKPLIIVILIITILVFGGIFNNIIDSLVANTRFSVYIDTGYDRSDIKYIALVVNSLLYGICYYILKQKKDITRTDILYINIMGMSILFAIMGNVYFLFNRVTYYFTIIQILSVPYYIYIEEQKTKENDNIDNMVVGKKNLILKAMVIILLATNIFYTNVLHNDDEVLPYKTIFEQKK